MQGKWQILGCIMASSYMSIVHLSYGTVNSRTQLKLQVLYRIFFIGIATNTIETLSYKLICFGIPVEVSAEVFCDNMSVVKTLSTPTSALNKRHNAIYHHRVRGDRASGILCVFWVPGDFNLVKLFTKTTMPRNKRHNLVDSILSNTASPIGDIEKAWFICTRVHLSTSHTTRLTW